MFKQKNIVVKPETAALADAEVAILERFGWKLARELPLGDDGRVLSYIRDDADTEAVEAEAAYRQSVAAKQYAERVKSDLSVEEKKKGCALSVVGKIFLGIFAVVFTALFALVAFIDVFYPAWGELIDLTLGSFTYGKGQSYPLGGGWEFLNAPILGYGEFKIVLSLFFLGIAVALISAFIMSIVKSSKKKREARALALFKEEKIAFFDGVIAECEEKLK